MNIRWPCLQKKRNFWDEIIRKNNGKSFARQNEKLCFSEDFKERSVVFREELIAQYGNGEVINDNKEGQVTL